MKKNAAIAILVNHAVKELVTNRGISTEEIRRMIETHRFVGNTKTILKHFRASIPESLFGKVEVAVKHMEAYTKRCEDSLLTKSPEKVSKGSIASAILAEFVREVGRATEKFQVDTIRNHRFLTNHYELKTSLIPLSSTYDLIKIFDFMKDQEGKKEMIPTFRIDMTSHDAYVYIP